jgi:hypothetical protein
VGWLAAPRLGRSTLGCRAAARARWPRRARTGAASAARARTSPREDLRARGRRSLGRGGARRRVSAGGAGPGRVVYRTASGHRRDCIVARGVVLHGDDLGVTERDDGRRLLGPSRNPARGARAAFGACRPGFGSPTPLAQTPATLRRDRALERRLWGPDQYQLPVPNSESVAKEANEPVAETVEEIGEMQAVPRVRSGAGVEPTQRGAATPHRF